MGENPTQVEQALIKLIDELGQNTVQIGDLKEQIIEHSATLHEVKKQTEATRRSVDWDKISQELVAKVRTANNSTSDKITFSVEKAKGIYADFNEKATEINEGLSDVRQLSYHVTTKLSEEMKRNWRQTVITVASAVILACALGAVGGVYWGQVISHKALGIDLMESYYPVGKCEGAGGEVVKGSEGSNFCAFPLPNYSS